MKLLRVLDRFRRGVEVRVLGEGQMGLAVEMVLHYYVEEGKEPSVALARRGRDWLLGVVENERGRVFGAFVGDEVAGMVVCSAVGPDVANGREVMALWCFWVYPQYRNNPRISLSLMRGVLEASRAWGCEVWRVQVMGDNDKLMQRYAKTLGFRWENDISTYGLVLEET